MIGRSNKIKALEYYELHYKNSNTFENVLIGEIINVALTDIMPNLRLDEFDTANGITYTDAIIDVFTNKEGVLTIADGHNRFLQALIEGKKRIDVKIVDVNVSNLYTGLNYWFSHKL